jgi:hypothetical protein
MGKSGRVISDEAKAACATRLRSSRENALEQRQSVVDEAEVVSEAA